jgi:hypothetical protein
VEIIARTYLRMVKRGEDIITRYMKIGTKGIVLISRFKIY